MSSRHAWIVAAAALLGCGDVTPTPPRPSVAPPIEPAAATIETAPPPVVLESAASAELVARGATLASSLECVRCHTIEGVPETTLEFDCVGCHRQIMAGELEFPAEELAGYQSRLHSLLDVPALRPGSRFRRAWLTAFLSDTHDLRPNLAPSMPRFSLAPDDVAALAAFLAPSEEAPPPVLGDAVAGRRVIEAKGCGTCHRFAGAEPLPATPLPITLAPDRLALGQRLAPDLAHVRTRMRPAALPTWLRDPEAAKPGTAMPKIPMTEQELLDVSAYLVQTPLRPVAAEPIPSRLPILARAVSYEEVDARIFHRTCRHCHSDPEQVIGDGGPGYGGGFGFRKRGLDLNSYAGVRSGSLDDAGKRRSLFEPTSSGGDEGMPRIVAHLWARHAEIAGAPIDGVRGMPLGLPAVAPEDIQLLETWIAQGRKPPAETDTETP
ncbi:MAG: c-type cytochrome [Myxococcales bacterium]|nr:c-type cytochrome [Myxococcales bacterium]